MLNENERRLLSTLLWHGGFCTPTLAASLLNLTNPQARKILAGLVDRGYIRRVFLLRAHDATNYFQVTRRGGKLLNYPHPNVARSNPDDPQILRGLARFWFASQPLSDGTLLSTPAEIAAEFEANGLKLPGNFPTGDTFFATPAGLQIYSFPSVCRGLDLAIKNAFLLYAESLDAIRLGFVIERRRATELQQILTDIVGAPVAAALTATPENHGLHEMKQRFANASAFEKIELQRQIQALETAPQAPEPPAQSELARLVLPTIIHDIF